PAERLLHDGLDRAKGPVSPRFLEVVDVAEHVRLERGLNPPSETALRRVELRCRPEPRGIFARRELRTFYVEIKVVVFCLGVVPEAVVTVHVECPSRLPIRGRRG